MFIIILPFIILTMYHSTNSLMEESCNYAIYTFTIHNRSTLFMANLMGTEPQYGTSLGALL